MSYLVTLPAYNEAAVIELTIARVYKYLNTNFPEMIEQGNIRICVAINGSTDDTESIVKACAERMRCLTYTVTPKKGRGAALDLTWSKAQEDVLLYTDSDLAYSLEDIGSMIRAHENSRCCDLAVASRRVKGSIVRRPFTRKVLTEGYNRLIKLLFFNSFTDAQAGCKSIKREAYVMLRKHVSVYDGWFFDTALLLYAEKRGYSISDLQITCIDNRTWRLAIFGTVAYFLRNLAALRFRTLFRGFR